MFTAKKDYYAILGVAPDATGEELKSAYRKKALELHPDLNGGSDSAEERFKQMTEAYAVLRDARSRSVYDAMRAAGPVGGEEGLDIENAMQAMFESPEFRKMFQSLATKLVTRGLSPAGLFKGGLGATGIWFVGALFMGGGKAILPKLAGSAAKSLLGGGAAYVLGKKVGAAKRNVEAAVFGNEDEKGEKKAAVSKDTRFTLELGRELLKSGGKVSLQIPGDKGNETISISVAPDSENGKLLRLPGKGAGGGDLVIELKRK